MSVRRRKWKDRKSGQEKVVWVVDIDFEHAGGERTRVRKTSPIQTRKGAEEYERQVRAELLAGTYERTEEVKDKEELPTFGEFADEFLKSYATNHNKPSTVASKRLIIERYLKPVFGSKELAHIGVRDIEEFVASHKRTGAAAMTINNYLIVLRRILSLAVEYRLLGEVPKCRKLKVPEQKFDFLSFEEAERFIAGSQAEPEWAVMILVALKTGLRQGEILALRWEDVDLDLGRLIVRRSVWEGIETPPKNGKTREIPLSIVRHALDEHQHERGAYVFCKKDGTPFNKQDCRRPLKRALQRSGLRHIGWHGLRHTFASHLAMRGVPIPAIKELLGHSTIQMTMRYAHLSPETKSNAVALLDPHCTPPASSGTLTAHGSEKEAPTH